MENSRKSMAMEERGRSKRARPKEEVELTEVNAMVSGDVGVAGAEWQALQEFHLYYLLLCVLVDWALSEHTLVLCFTQDMIIFLSVCLPTSTLFFMVTLLQNTPVAVAACWLTLPHLLHPSIISMHRTNGAWTEHDLLFFYLWIIIFKFHSCLFYFIDCLELTWQL